MIKLGPCAPLHSPFHTYCKSAMHARSLWGDFLLATNGVRLWICYNRTRPKVPMQKSPASLYFKFLFSLQQKIKSRSQLKKLIHIRPSMSQTRNWHAVYATTKEVHTKTHARREPQMHPRREMQVWRNRPIWLRVVCASRERERRTHSSHSHSHTSRRAR